MQKSQKTTLVKRDEAIAQRRWYVVDLDGQTLGRVATRIASVLRGKHKPNYMPNVDVGDFVVVINAEKVRLTGSKPADKMYRYHTHYPGGLRECTALQQLAHAPDRVIRSAVWGMLPKNRLGRQMIKKLKIYTGPSHNHSAQAPKPLALS